MTILRLRMLKRYGKLFDKRVAVKFRRRCLPEAHVSFLEKPWPRRPARACRRGKLSLDCRGGRLSERRKAASFAHCCMKFQSSFFFAAHIFRRVYRSDNSRYFPGSTANWAPSSVTSARGFPSIVELKVGIGRELSELIRHIVPWAVSGANITTFDAR